ncbi:uncharacterized protein LOC124447934 [Xenia sp. Carnegie-2017]|uniref:uncharacterized protein LOC124447934 n=1 Tax=Xenia sp. Carnegie-2017 TaxID=2897299 RepID=UPI001F047101|nr:uncharacterized protein LOC124447934 [Xenia sp. Carnegie-2017]
MERANRGLAKLNRGSDKKEEARIKTLDQANWDQFIAPAPMSIALLGQLILVSADTDFSLNDDGTSFKHLKHPKSFRACLVQVSNGGYKAFNTAHTNMDQIRLYSGNVDAHVRTAMRILLGGTSSEVELMLPNSLRAIEKIAKECVTLSCSAEEEFLGVMELIGELLEACTKAQGRNTKDSGKTKIAVEVLNTYKKKYRSKKGRCRKEEKRNASNNTNLPESNDKDLRAKVKAILTKSVQICEELNELASMMNINKEKVKDLTKRAEKLSFESESLKVAFDVAQGASPIVNNPPHLEKLAKQRTSGDGGDLVKSAIEVARFKTETAKVMLQDSRDRYDRSCEILAQQMKEYGNVLAKLAEQDLKKIDIETIRQILIKGMRVLGELQEKWGKLVQFFQMLSNLVKCSLESSLELFTSTTRNSAKLGAKGEIMSNTMRDVLFEQAFGANKIAYVVNSISDAYCDISQAYLMPQVIHLGRLIALNPATDQREINLKREELNDGCMTAQDAIKQIARKKRREIDQIFEKRIKKIEDEVEALMPPLPKEKILEIKEKAKATLRLGKNTIEEDVDYYA